MATTQKSNTERNARQNRRKTYKSPLSEIEFEAASDVIKYAELMRVIGRSMQLELHTAADELQAVLAGSAGSVYERYQAKRKAKKIANHLRKAGDAAKGISVEGVKLARGFRREYALLLDPPKNANKRALDWKE